MFVVQQSFMGMGSVNWFQLAGLLVDDAFLLFQGWYIVTYALGIYHLNLFIAFLSPKVDPSLMEDSGTAGPVECCQSAFSLG